MLDAEPKRNTTNSGSEETDMKEEMQGRRKVNVEKNDLKRLSMVWKGKKMGWNARGMEIKEPREKGMKNSDGQEEGTDLRQMRRIRNRRREESKVSLKKK